MAKRVDIGGQAVIEGVMMRSPDMVGIAVRKADGSIATRKEPYVSPAKKHRWMGWPFVRGVVSLVTMMTSGMHVIDVASKMLGADEEEPSKFEKWLSEKLGKSVDKVVMGVAMVLAVALSLFLFMVIPSFAATLFNRFIPSLLIVNLLTGIVRIGILVAYMGLTGLIPDMRRTYQYHGAEHKTVYCNEAGLELTPENARGFSCHHPRCGTSFLLLVMIIAVLVGATVDEILHLLFHVERLSFIARLGRSLLILPIISGCSYEALKGLAHSDNALVRLLRWPGMKLQNLTTREPDDSMLEVAIAAMKIAKGEMDAPDVSEMENEEKKNDGENTVEAK